VQTIAKAQTTPGHRAEEHAEAEDLMNTANTTNTDITAATNTNTNTNDTTTESLPNHQSHNNHHHNNNNNKETTTTTTTTTTQEEEEEEEELVRRRQELLLVGPLRAAPSASSDDLPLIHVSMCRGVFLVWSPDHVFLLRSRYRIVGALLGALPFAAQQNDTASVPLSLSYEELALLHSLGCLRLHVAPDSVARLGADARAAYYARRKAIEQLRFSIALLQRRVLELKFRAAAGAAGKKRKQPPSDGSAAAADAATTDFAVSLDDIADAESKIAANGAALDQLFAEYAASCAVDADDAADAAALTADGAPASELPPLPASTTAAHCAVFADLWQRGFYLTSASKFGGDFLAYMGDPLKYHAAFVVVVSRSNEPLLLCEIAALGRLANAVKKTGVIASHDSDHVSYLTIDWRSMTK
jgi:tRNA-splicing endonuclease subunit Sen34